MIAPDPFFIIAFCASREWRNHVEYVDDTGFTATGDVIDGLLYHEELVLYRER